MLATLAHVWYVNPHDTTQLVSLPSKPFHVIRAGEYTNQGWIDIRNHKYRIRTSLLLDVPKFNRLITDKDTLALIRFRFTP